MLGHARSWSLALLLASAALLPPGTLSAAPVAVRHTEGLVHGFLVLRTLEGDTLADGDLIQVAHGDRVTNHLVFSFRDGSVRDETAIFSQRGNFRLLNYHLVQKGPAFQRPMEVLVDNATGQVRVRYTDEDAKEKVITDRQGAEPFSIGGSRRKAIHYVLKVEIGGVAGVVAPLLGKQPPDSHVWILGGEAPAFVKSEGPLYLGGPIWRIELTSPVWPQVPAADSKNGKDKREIKH